jgi:hypothetical protein
MNSKMVVRILSISIALLFLGVFLPSLTNGAVSPLSVTFNGDDGDEGVVVGSQESQFLNIKNTNDGATNVTFYLLEAACGFSLAYGEDAFTFEEENGYVVFLTVDGVPVEIPSGESIDLEIIFAPTEPGTCNGTLWISAGGVAPVSLTGIAVEAPALTNIIIDGQDTNVLDFEYKNMRFSEWLDVIAAEARNHGQYVKLVAFWARRAHKAGNLEKEEIKAIVKAAIHAKIPKEGVITGKKEKHHGRRHTAWFGSHGGHHK